MLLSGHAHTVAPGEGQTVDLGIIQMRVLAAGEATTSRAFTLAEFTGGEGSWTVPHIHHAMEESFYVLDGQYVFTVGEEKIPAGPGSYVLVPRGTRHTITAGAGRPAPDAHGPGWPGGDVHRARNLATGQHHRPGRAGCDLRQIRLKPGLGASLPPGRKVVPGWGPMALGSRHATYG